MTFLGAGQCYGGKATQHTGLGQAEVIGPPKAGQVAGVLGGGGDGFAGGGLDSAHLLAQFAGELAGVTRMIRSDREGRGCPRWAGGD